MFCCIQRDKEWSKRATNGRKWAKNVRPCITLYKIGVPTLRSIHTVSLHWAKENAFKFVMPQLWVSLSWFRFYQLRFLSLFCFANLPKLEHLDVNRNLNLQLLILPTTTFVCSFWQTDHHEDFKWHLLKAHKILFSIVRWLWHQNLLHDWVTIRDDRLHRMTFHVSFQCLPRGKHFRANHAALGLVIVQSLDVDFKSVTRPKLFAALRTEVTLIKMILLDVVCQVCLVGAEIIAHRATPTPAHTILRPHLHRHRLDHM